MCAGRKNTRQRREREHSNKATRVARTNQGDNTQQTLISMQRVKVQSCTMHCKKNVKGRHHATTDLAAAARRSVLQDLRPELREPILLLVSDVAKPSGHLEARVLKTVVLRHRVLVNVNKGGLVGIALWTVGCGCRHWIGTFVLSAWGELLSADLCEYFGGLPTSLQTPKCWPFLNPVVQPATIVDAVVYGTAPRTPQKPQATGERRQIVR